MDDLIGGTGLVCVAAAAFMVGVAAGLAVTGAVLLFVAWRVSK